jgi:hypothetical protein
MAESVEWSSAEKANATNSDQIIESVCFIFYPFNGGTKPPCQWSVLVIC